MIRGAFIVALLLGTGYAAAAAEDLDSSYQSLQEALAKKDPALVKKLAAQTAEFAKQAACESAPQAADEQDGWKKRVAYANEIQSYTEYALYALAVQLDPAGMVDLMSTLEQQNPKSKYLDQGYGAYLVAMAKTGSEGKVVPVAEKAVGSFPQNPDILRVLAESAMTKKQTDRALGYANRLVAAAGKRAKPETQPAADWERLRSAWLASGYWISGAISAEKGLYAAADKNLRAALPLVRGDDYRTGIALFYLGVANYNVGKATLEKAKVLEAAKFSDEAAKFNTPVAHQAWVNAQLMKSDAAKMR
jgi:tetratricopeptide (TPR) repeat protein